MDKAKRDKFKELEAVQNDFFDNPYGFGSRKKLKKIGDLYSEIKNM